MATPEGPQTIQNVHRYLEKKNMYSPLFDCAYRLFNEGGSREEMRELIINACQFDRREKEFVGTISRIFYRLFPSLWYRRRDGLLSQL